MSCNSKENTLSFLQGKGVVDSNNNILDNNTFSFLNEELTKFAETEYGAANGRTLFSNNNGKAVANQELFNLIDSNLDQQLHSPIDFETDMFYNAVDLTPSFESYIEYKKNLLSRMEERLASVKAEKRKHSSDTAKVKELTALESELKTRIDGSKEREIQGLKEEIAELSRTPDLQKFGYYIDNDFKRLDSLVQSDSPKDLNEAKVIINFYKTLGTFDTTKRHPLFEYEQMFDDAGNLTLDRDTVEAFTKVSMDAQKYDNIIARQSEKAVMDAINSNAKIKAVYGEDNNFSYEDIFHTKTGLKDTSWADMFLMDITNGIFSSNGIVPQVMMNIIQNSFESNLVYAKDIEQRVSDIQSKVESELSRLGYSINIPGVRGVTYDLFRAMDANGQFKDTITQRYTSEFIDARNRMLSKFDEQIDAANSLEDPRQKQQAYKVAHANKKNWYKKNTIVLDVRRIPEIINDNSFSEFANTFQSANSDVYATYLKDLLGEKGYQEEVNKQIKLLKDYQTALEVTKDKIVAEDGAADVSSLSTEGKRKLEMWQKRNNPFTMTSEYYDGTAIKQGKLLLDSNMGYNYAIPRRKKALLSVSERGFETTETDEDSGFYDSRFETIESNDTLKEFHNILMDLNQKMFDVMPPEVRKKFNAYSLPALKKSILEILTDKNTPSFFKRLSKAAKEIYDRIWSLFGINPQNSMSYAKVDPVTGRPEYKVNSNFLESNKQTINSKYAIEMERIRTAIKLDRSISKYDAFNLNMTPQSVIDILAENLGVAPTIAAIKNRLPNENIEAFEMGKVMRNAVTHQVVMEQSFDLPKMMKLFSYLTMEYAARQEVLPIMEMMKQHYDSMKAPAVTGIGEEITNASTGETRLEGERVRAMKQMNSWFERVALGNYGSKNEVGDTRIIREGILGLTHNEKIDAFTSKLQMSVDGRIRNSDEKLMVKKIDGLIANLKERLQTESELTDEQKGAINERIEFLEGKKSNLGKQFSVTAAFDAMFNFIRLKGLGWNLSSYITNFMEGQIANMTIAATGDYFTPENIYKANHIVKGSFLKNMTFGKFATPGAKKASVLMNRYRILQDASNELQKASSKSAFNKFEAFSPYEGTKRTEYLNQTPLMIATLMDIKIKGTQEGQEASVWDAMNPDGTLKEEFRTEENIANWEQANGNNYNDFASKMRKMIVNAHGDYDELRGNMASEYISGKALLMFKRWMARQFYQRFAMTPQPDIEVGMKEYKGRYLSHTKGSGALHLGIVGFGGFALLGAGPLGFAIGGVAGGLLGKFYGANTGLNYLQEMAVIGKELAMSIARIPLNNLTGKQLIREADFSKFEEMTERDVRNLKANLVDMSVTLAWIGMLLFTKALLWDDEDKEEDSRRKVHNFLVNRFMQLSGSATMYLNPTEAYKSSVGTIPLMRFFEDVGKTAKEAQDYLEGKDVIPSGPNAGESAFYNQFEKTFLPGILKSGAGFSTHTKKQFQQSAFDSWFWSEEKKARKVIQGKRAEYRKELKESGGLTDKEINKKVEEKHPYPKKKKDKK